MLAAAILGTTSLGHLYGYWDTVKALSPVGYWRLGDNAGTVAVDEMGANNGTYVNSPTLGATGLLTGDSDTAVSFAAGTQGAPFNSRTGFPSGASARTYVAWLKTSTTVAQCVLMWGSSGAGDHASEWYLSNNNVRHHSGVTDANLGAMTADGTTKMCAIVYNGSAWQLYVNGAAVGSTVAQTLNTTTPGTWAVGTAGIATDAGFIANNFNGTLDEVAIWNRALTAAEVASLYTAGSTTPTTVIGAASVSKALYIDGLDVLYQPGTPGALYGVPIETIQLTEAGPGQVSSMSFTIEDPNGVISLQAGGFVRFHDITRDLPLFTGFLETFAPVAFGITRAIEVSCIGIEAVLDWMIVPSLTIAAGTTDGIIGSILAAAVGIGVPLNIAVGAVGSTRTQPVAASPVTNNTLVFTNQTVRQCLQSAFVADLGAFALAPGQTIDSRFTVDFYQGLRTAYVQTGVLDVADWATVTINSSGPLYPTNTQHLTDAGSAVRQVVVVGGNPAGSGLVTDGSGVPGSVAVLSDATIQDAATKIAAALNYMATNGINVAGTVGVAGANVGTAGAENRAGGPFVLTDTNLGLAAYSNWISQIDKIFTSGEEIWTITYGSTVKGSQFIRRLTRAVLG